MVVKMMFLASLSIGDVSQHSITLMPRLFCSCQ